MDMILEFWIAERKALMFFKKNETPVNQVEFRIKTKEWDYSILTTANIVRNVYTIFYRDEEGERIFLEHEIQEKTVFLLITEALRRIATHGTEVILSGETEGFRKFIDKLSRSPWTTKPLPHIIWQ